MLDDFNTAESPTDTPPSAWQHAWKKAARDDSRMKARHVAVIDAYAEHYYPGKEAMRGVGVSVARVAYWTKLGATSVREARADLIRWGWLGRVKGHGPSRVARYALTLPEQAAETLGTTAGVIPKESATRTFSNVEQASEESATRTFKGSKNPPRGHIPLPTPLHLPTSPRATTDTTHSTPAPPRGRQAKPSTPTTPRKAAGATQRDRDAVLGVLPPDVADSARLARSMPQLAAALAGAYTAGWTEAQVRAELTDAGRGAHSPLGVVVSRLVALGQTAPPAPKPVALTDDQLARTIAAGFVCDHGNADMTNPATGLHVCPICRRRAQAV